MKDAPAWRRYLRLWGPDVDADVSDELEFHLEMRTRELVEQGWPAGEARHEAQRLFALLAGVAGALAVILACIGLYGTLSYAVSRRTREIGIRMTLGAERGDILRSTMREMVLVVLGVALGLVGVWAATRWLESLLFGLSPTDPRTLCLATLLLSAVAACAVYIPARRASRVDPWQALRGG